MFKFFLPLLFTLFIFNGVKAQLNYKAMTYYKSGLKFKEQLKLTEALNAFTESIKLNNKFDSAHVESGMVNIMYAQYDAAIINFRNAITVNPKMTIALATLAKIYRDNKPNFDSAIYFYKRALQTDKTDKDIYYGLAWTYNAQKEYDSAIVYAVQLLELDNQYRAAYGELAHAYRNSKQYVKAIEQFKKNLAISTVDIALLYSGYCYVELKDKAGAMEMYEELKKVNEKMSQALKRQIDKMD